MAFDPERKTKSKGLKPPQDTILIIQSQIIFTRREVVKYKNTVAQEIQRLAEAMVYSCTGLHAKKQKDYAKMVRKA